MLLRSLLAMSVALIAVAPVAAKGPSTTVKVDTGPLTGTADGDTISYRGIPYAAPPVGPLRWKAPQPAAAWTGIRAATKFGFACPQDNAHAKDAWAQVGPQSEDCLFLNVWRPAKPGKYPVMVFIHGGAFTYGAAGVPLYDGAALAKRGAVIVTINYRLGRLGFFAHPGLTKEDPAGLLGNYGIMDQIAALQWVKRNIAGFAGDAANVTIFGESAGAGSVQILMAAPLSRGLFQKAISESGAGNSVLPPIRGGAINAEMLGTAWASGLGLKDATADQLRAVPLADVVKNGRAFPFIDVKVVTRSPGDPFYNGGQMKIPLMIGGNSNESSLGGMTEPAAKALLGDQFGPLLDGYIALSGKPRDKAVIDLAEDVGFVLPSFALADQQAKVNPNTFVYFFDQVPVDLRATAAGTDHGGEVEYVFGTKAAEHAWDARDTEVSRIMGNYWVNFARTGNPNGAGVPKWPAVTTGPTTYLYVGADVQAKRLAPVQEQAKAATMAIAIKKWPTITVQ